MNIPWDDVRLFLAVAESGSITAAARKLRVGQPTVSRRLALLERSMGATLFRRSVDGTALTMAGERLLAPARRMAEWAGEVARAAGRAQSSPSGLVRVTATPLIAHDFLAPFASWLAQKYPLLRLEVLSAMEHLDLARGEADIALRVRAPSQPELVRVHTVEFRMAAFVSRSLAARLPRKPRPEHVPWIAWAPPYDRLPPNPQLEELVAGFTPAFASDHFLVNLAAAEAGLGAIVLARARHRFSRPSSLVPLDVKLGSHERGAIHLVCARSALEIPRIRVVVELITTELQRVREV